MAFDVLVRISAWFYLVIVVISVVSTLITIEEGTPKWWAGMLQLLGLGMAVILCGRALLWW